MRTSHRSLVFVFLFFSFSAGLTAHGETARFFAISSSLNSSIDSLISYNADGQVVLDVDFAAGATPTFMATDGEDLFLNLGSLGGIARRGIDSSDPFELFHPLSGATPRQLEFDKAGNLYSVGDLAIRRFDTNGDLTLELPIVAAWGIDADAQGNIYVSFSNPGSMGSRIERYTASGNLDLSFRAPFSFGSAIAIDELNDRLYVGKQGGELAIFDISSSSPFELGSMDIPGMDLLIDMSLDHLTGHLLVAGLGGVFELDANGSFLLYNDDGNRFFSGVAALPGPSGEGADLNGDLDLDQVDLDAMTRAVVGETGDMSFDLSGDGAVNRADRDAWLQIAAEENLPAGAAYAMGDANLDGLVNAEDFSIWNQHKFQRLAAWSKGDFNSDGVVDGEDFVIWNEGRLTGGAAVAVAVPEPSSVWIVVGLLGLVVTARRSSAH